MAKTLEQSVSYAHISRRSFLFGAGASGLVLSCRSAWSKQVIDAAVRFHKRITLLHDGSFEHDAWGWQFTTGARVVDAPGVGKRKAVRIATESGDYARFLVLGPEEGKSYTLSGWVRTESVVPSEDGSGAYFSASQFEFQGRPTAFTVDGKQAEEERYGNYSGNTEWKRFAQTFQCLPSTAWFEVIVGIYRASGKAWFRHLTFVEGNQAADFEDVVDFWQAAQWAHEANLLAGSRQRPVALILKDDLPVRGKASDPEVLAMALSATHRVRFVNAEELGAPEIVCRAQADLVVLPYGESFPLAAWKTVQNFLADGGDLFSVGGYAFRSPVIQDKGKWEFYETKVNRESGANLLPELALQAQAWKATEGTDAVETDVAVPELGQRTGIKIAIPKHVWERNAECFFDLPAAGGAKQFMFRGWVRTEDVQPAPSGYAYVGVEQLDESGEPAYAAKMAFERIRGSRGWHKVESIFYLVPETRRLRVRFGMENATGTIEGAGFRLEARSPQVRLNTGLGHPEDQLVVKPTQIGMFDADFRLKHTVHLQPHKNQFVLKSAEAFDGAFEGYAASAVVGMNNARWIPLLEGQDASGRNRGAAGALTYQMHGPYARGCWAFFGVENQDLFAKGSDAGRSMIESVARAMARKCFLHDCGTTYACYRDGEAVCIRVLVSNYGRSVIAPKVRWRIYGGDTNQVVFEQEQPIELAAGQTISKSVEWQTSVFDSERYRVEAVLLHKDDEIDRREIGFNIWKQEALSKGLAFQFRDNYFQVDGKSVFLQGTDDYLHTFIDQCENPLTWREDAQGCHDSCIDVYENLMGLRGPQQRPTEEWWRWIDAMLLNVESTGGAFFPGMLIFSNTAVSNKDLADQEAYVRTFAARYKDAPGIMYYLNGDLELHDPNIPDLQKLYNEYLLKKYGSDDALRRAWTVSPPEKTIGQLSVRSGSQKWEDVRTLDDFQFRADLVRRWLNSMHAAIREVDQKHPVTAEFYSSPVSGIDLLTALGDLELANFGYFNDKDEDFYRFPQTCKFLDQSARGKGINVGEFGVKTHPAWRSTGYYIEARTESYEQSYFLAIAHYAFALGASKIQNWCWKYPADLPFEWGINYPNELTPRDVRFYYRNTGMLFRSLCPRYESSDILMLIASDNRMGGQGERVIEGQLNAVRLLLDQRVRFHTLADKYLRSIDSGVKTIFYPLPYCPDDGIVQRLREFVEDGGQLYISGDISYDSLRRRTRTDRLKQLCGVDFVKERFPNLEYQNGALPTKPGNSPWPQYVAAPGIVVKPAGASVLLEAIDGTPLVTEYALGKGRVVLSTDPIELHGDPRYQEYAHQFYGQLTTVMNVSGAPVTPEAAPVHCFRVPSQDSREVHVLVNYSDVQDVKNLRIEVAGYQVQLSLDGKMSGIVVAEPGNGVQAVESSGNVVVDERLLAASRSHFMAISFAHEDLMTSRMILLLPMGDGEIRLANVDRWKKPVVLVGGNEGSQWRQFEKFYPGQMEAALVVPVTPERSLQMLIVCESGQESNAIERMGTWLNAPWKMNGQA